MSLSACDGAEARPPNVVFFLADDVGWSDLGCYGNEYHETPNIDRLAAAGMRFTQAYAAAPNCSASRASILTGNFPARLGITQYLPGNYPDDVALEAPELPAGLPHGVDTLAEILRRAGYATASIGKWHLGDGEYLPEQHGFDLNFGGGPRGRHASMFAPFGVPNMDGKPGEYLTDRLVRRAESFLAANRDRPFFLFLSSYAVHEPVEGKPELVEHYRAKRAALGDAPSRPGYAATVHVLDEGVGRIRAKLAELGLAERTLVVFFSDNGGNPRNTSNAPLRGGKGSLYEGGIRVPLIVHWPGRTEPGSECHTPTTSVDFLPTIIALTGLGETEHVRSLHADGTSLVPLLAAEGEFERTTLHWHYPHYSKSGAPPCAAIRRGDYKLIEFFEDGRLELYDLAADSGERDDLASERTTLASELRVELAAWRTDVNAQMPTRR